MPNLCAIALLGMQITARAERTLRRKYVTVTVLWRVHGRGGSSSLYSYIVLIDVPGDDGDIHVVCWWMNNTSDGTF